ncbi:hypothetical protein F0562_008871 [Nyssa sinensis]|uniref:Uncharacterized protein n=1 Tax=Nyssa sinensis TaxID=561372 RepID=A0A5J5A8R9_9ASTE|nr:hypothetical protein F0562_008871 [Nyssa sinensis]
MVLMLYSGQQVMVTGLRGNMYLSLYQAPLARSNGNYIAIFSSKIPCQARQEQEVRKPWCFQGSSFCNFSLNGDKLVSGSSDTFSFTTLDTLSIQRI